MNQPYLLLNLWQKHSLNYNTILYKEWGPQQLKMANIHILFILKYEAKSVRSPGICRVIVTQHVHQKDSKTSVVHTYLVWKNPDAVNHQNRKQSLPAEPNTFWN